MHRINWLLVLYDVLIYALVNVLFLYLFPSGSAVPPFLPATMLVLTGAVCLLVGRIALGVYNQIWRYGDIHAYLRLMAADAVGGILYYAVQSLFFTWKLSFLRMSSIVCVNLLGAIAMRMLYQSVYRESHRQDRLGGFARWLIRVMSGRTVRADTDRFSETSIRKIKIAIVGAGRVGISLAEELMNNPHAAYTPCCFVDANKKKIGRQVYGLPVLSEEDATTSLLAKYGVQEIVFAIPQLDLDTKQRLYGYYKKCGCKIKSYDFPTMQIAGGKRTLREFDVEELLFRQPVELKDAGASAYYKDKTVLVTGGGGSIGSELCRQIAKMQPKKLIILDICENGAYDVQQELRFAYKGALDLSVEIVSICDRAGLEQIFKTYRPDIVLHAAAHKHVPLMEHNVCEAIKNNVFGTLNTVALSEQYGVGRFLMVSTDKAVNPTNVMGATKRLCEMIVQSYSESGKTVYSATRFGNVLGSAGSVIPLFKRQIAAGGPVTLTDKRIIRYFMTVPEACQLVLQSGAMAKNGELFVLDMGKPVKILDLAENMIRLSGYEPYRDIEIVETGLRPGEKLYEELLIKSEELNKTAIDRIFIERDHPLSRFELELRLEDLRSAILAEDEDAARAALHRAVPTFRTPEEVNAAAFAKEVSAADSAAPAPANI